MSAIWNLTSNQGVVLGCNHGGNFDDAIQPPDYRRTLPYSYELSDREVDVVWSRSRRIGADYSNDPQIWDNMPNRWEWCWPNTGQHTPKKVIGVTKDSTGTPIGGVTVLLFNTATNLLVDTVVSDANGNYQASDPNNVTCFTVGYLVGSPDTAGVTKNNITGV